MVINYQLSIINYLDIALVQRCRFVTIKTHISSFLFIL